MIILDTNVLSALMQPSPEKVVSRWLDSQPSESIWTTTITLFEIHLGLENMAPGSRKMNLTSAFDMLLHQDLENRVLDLDSAAAMAAATFAAARRAAGRSVDVRDTLIAGIAVARRGSIATRNIKHFEDAGIPILNPWGEEH
jgi:hypothetical protein